MTTKIMEIEKREVEISLAETVEKMINYAKGCKYCEPQDENERWFNRWIDRVINMFENYIETNE